MDDLYFEDFTPGREFRTEGVTVTESQILDFALAFDPQPFHLDAEAAKGTIFGGLIASGFHTMALTFRLFAQTRALVACSLGSPGVDEAALAPAGAPRGHAAGHRAGRGAAPVHLEARPGHRAACTGRR